VPQSSSAPTRLQNPVPGTPGGGVKS
jgi:hypothetical protein